MTRVKYYEITLHLNNIHDLLRRFYLHISARFWALALI